MASANLVVQDIKGAVVAMFRSGSILDSATIDAIGRQLYELVDQQAVKRLVLDFEHVQFLSSQALGMLITLKKKSDAIGGVVLIAGLRPDLKRVFKIMKLNKLFKFYDNDRDALASLDIYLA
jgi:anti-anti-sigma factor